SSVLAQEDRKCLQGIKNSLHDPRSAFDNWNFTMLGRPKALELGLDHLLSKKDLDITMFE
ncbi:inactive LRR receptor-like serine/threonine-protein kinase BIR2, partial [Tanacetum coccineum]